MVVTYTWEHNGNDTLIYFHDYPGAYVRGNSREAALKKAEQELLSYLLWRDGTVPTESFAFSMDGEHEADLQVCDADSDVLLACERGALTREEYNSLKSLALRSALCFQTLYDSVPDKAASVHPRRKTFYGQVPATAEEMYRHTKNVNAYYFDQIGVETDNEPDIYTCRKRGFALVEAQPDFLKNTVVEGDYDELWSLRKLCRRFIWHDRIHAKAMRRLAVSLFDPQKISNPFYF